MDNLAVSEPVLRTGIFLGIFLLLALLETWLPRRDRRLTRLRRWPGNIGIAVLNQMLARVLIPATAVTLAVDNADKGMGILNRIVLPGWLEFALALLLLDLVIYTQHVVFHKVPWLWRIHRMHHADTDFDTSTALRFHPVEILLSAFIKLWAVTLIGASASAVLVFEVLLNAAALFNHSNLAIPSGLDRLLRYLIVTPDMHRVHHSIIRTETDRNFGFNFPWWDRLFGTYQAQPQAPHATMTLGLEEFREAREAILERMLTQPFRHPVE
jgi:sterol desaturase/sphingolipid hydroxylase (fatty acid hydroxylase superfamily)